MIPPRDKPSRLSNSPRPRKQKLGEGEGMSREEFLSLCRGYVTLFKKDLCSVHGGSAGGREVVRTYSRMVDSVVSVLFQQAAREHGLSPGETGMAVIGMGGYGREELSPYSDVDILIISKRRTPMVKKVAATYVQLMWDVGFELGHSVEALVESESMLTRSMDTITALFESRWICGSRRIAQETERLIKRIKRKDREAYLKKKIRDAMARHRKYGNSYQLVEPNLKNSPGGLRDFQTLVWLGMVNRGSTGLPVLRARGLLLPGEEKALVRAYSFLLRIRVELHTAMESKQDHLTVRVQQIISRRLGYSRSREHFGVEMFMRDYYNHTRTIFRITEDIIEELDYGNDVSPLLGRKRVARDKGTLSMRLDKRKLRQNPLAVFVRQKETGLKLDRSLRRRMEVALASDLAGRRERDRMRKEFPKLLENGRSLSLVLRSMHETGFLGAVIPEYNELTSLKRYDLYHHYTVDEHSFQVVHNLELLAKATGREPIARIYSEIPGKRVLFLAALLHDVGKIEGRGHAKKGAVLSRRILERMSLDPEEIRAVSYLIEIHLLMSHFSQRRDATDAGTLRSFCSIVQTRTNLKYLCLLTYADLKATSPVVWTQWKKSLLWDLYLKAYRFMETKEKRPEAVYKSRKQTLLRSFRAGRERERALRHLDMLPGRYLLTTSASQVRRHLDLIECLDGRPASMDSRRRKLVTEITFCTLDKPFRLSQLCGVLTINDCNILHAHAFTRADGKVIDVFHVEDLSGTARIDAARIARIEGNLVAVLEGELNIHAAFDEHVARWKRRKVTAIPAPPRVEFENDVSKEVTIVDVFAMDEPGLLFKITRALSEEGLQIHRARISTEANRAIDSFDVLNKRGERITSVSRLRKIRERLERTLS